MLISGQTGAGVGHEFRSSRETRIKTFSTYSTLDWSVTSICLPFHVYIYLVVLRYLNVSSKPFLEVIIHQKQSWKLPHFLSPPLRALSPFARADGSAFFNSLYEERGRIEHYRVYFGFNEVMSTTCINYVAFLLRFQIFLQLNHKLDGRKTHKK